MVIIGNWLFRGKTDPTEAGSVACEQGLQVLGAYGFCLRFIYYRAIYKGILGYLVFMKGTYGLYSPRNLLGRKKFYGEMVRL